MCTYEASTPKCKNPKFISLLTRHDRVSIVFVGGRGSAFDAAHRRSAGFNEGAGVNHPGQTSSAAAAGAPHFRVEYDLSFTGGEYSGVGQFAYVPLSLVDEGLSPEEAFTRHTGLAAFHTIQYTLDEPVTALGERFED